MTLRSPAQTPCQRCNQLFHAMDLMGYGEDGPFCSRCLQAVRAGGPLKGASDAEASGAGRSSFFKLFLAVASASLALSIAAVTLMGLV